MATKTVATPATGEVKTRANGVMKCEITGAVLKWTFKDGQVMEADTAKMPIEIRDQLITHGAKQKIGDGAALGQTATIAERLAEMKKIRDSLYAGSWNAERSPTGPRIEDLVAAMVVLKPNVPEATIRAKVTGYSAEERLALSRRDDVAAEITKLVVARAKASGSAAVADKLFDELA